MMHNKDKRLGNFFFLVSHNWLGCHRISSYMVFRIESIINWMMMPFMTIYFKQKKKKKYEIYATKKNIWKLFQSSIESIYIKFSLSMEKEEKKSK